MRVKSRNSGFSLVELLTVIAIIAILAAIIFPVMTSVKNKANENACITNLHQISVAVSMFKTDNRRYPDVLGAEVYNDNGELWLANGGNPKIFESCKDKYLFPEYVKGSIKVFHCPSSPVTNSADSAIYLRVHGDDATEVAVFAYDSYDCMVMGSGQAEGNIKIFQEDRDAFPHYRTSWVPASKVGDGIAWIAGSGINAYPPGIADTSAIQQEDYERQLRFRNPPGDTVVTWCGYHEGVNFGGRAPVVFLDGHVDNLPAKEVELCKWRELHKKN